MRKLLFVLTACVLSVLMSAVSYAIYVPPAFPAGPAATLVTCTELQVSANTRYICTIPTVAASGSAVFKVPTLKTAGKIDEPYFETLSTDCDIWLSGLDNAAYTEAPVFHFTGINLTFNPEIKARDYVNMDTVQVKFQYLTVDNQDAVNATGSSILILDFIRN